MLVLKISATRRFQKETWKQFRRHPLCVCRALGAGRAGGRADRWGLWALICQGALQSWEIESRKERTHWYIPKKILAVAAAVLSCIWLFVMPWTVARQAALSMDFPGKTTGVGRHALLQRIFLTRDLTCVSCVSCIGRQILYHWATWEALEFI